MKNKTIELTDKERHETSQKIEEIVKDVYYNGTEQNVNVYFARPRRKIPDFTILFQAANRMLSKDLSPIECKLLLLLYSDAGYNNYLGRSVLTLAEDCNLSRQTISNALCRLMKLGIITRIRSTRGDARFYEYCINPYMSWKGGMPARDKAMKVINETMKKTFPKQLQLFKHEEEISMNNAIKKRYE